MTDFSAARRKMVDSQVRPSDVTDLRVIEAMLAVPRESFVDAARGALAYLDLDVPLADGASPRFLLKPMTLARLLQAALIKPEDHMLVVGCATGYSAALAAHLAGSVVALESDAALAERARRTLDHLGAAVEVVSGPLQAGVPRRGPYDVILLDGESEVIPHELLDQLKMGGRLVGVIAEAGRHQGRIFTRSPHDRGSRPIFDGRAPVLPGFEQPAAFAF